MDREHAPTRAEIAIALGAAAHLWDSLTAALDEAYGIEPAFVPPSKSYGWDVKYRKGGRTLVSLTPDRGAFTALVVLGAKEVEAAEDVELGEHVRAVFDEAAQYHDGRWLFVRVESERDVEDVLALLRLKRRPLKRGLSGSHA
jgi:hypothetical protein